MLLYKGRTGYIFSPWVVSHVCSILHTLSQINLSADYNSLSPLKILTKLPVLIDHSAKWDCHSCLVMLGPSVAVILSPQ